MPRLPDKQQRILDFIREQHATTGVFPSVREIAAHMDFKSTNTVDYHLRRMEAGGVIERGSRRARSFAGVSAGDGNGHSPASGHNRLLAGKFGRGALNEIPLLGRVAAGQPILAEQHFDDNVSFSSLFHCDDQTFALQVKGDSMVEAGIVEGDLVIVKHQSAVANGEIGVALVDGEATVKRIYDEGDKWRLEPENSTMRPLVVIKGQAEFSVAGKVVGVVRKL
jgi:repressor LexA